MNSEIFNTLLQNYLARIASEQEAAEFMELIRDPENERRVKKLLEEKLKEDSSWLGDDEELEEEIQQILAKSNKRKSRSIRVWLAAASLTIIAAAGIFLYLKNINKEDFTIPADKTVTLYGADYVRLPDGSVVTLKEGSTLTYTKKYGVDTREVTLTGEAFFDVAHNPFTPFKVRTGKIVTTVLGTAFNIKVTVGEKVTVTVSRGEVAVGDGRTTYGTITPNEQIAVNTKSNDAVKSVVDVGLVTQWKQNYFILEKVTFAEAAKMIAKRFNVKVTVANKSLNKCVISAWFLNNETLDQVLKAVSAFRQAKYTVMNGNVTIHDGRGCD
jgi:transmembrane sensor